MDMGQVISMTSTKDASIHSGSTESRPSRNWRVHAARVPTLRTCGCGLPAAFDVDKHEFFCIGCGGSKECLCRRSRFATSSRPVRV